MQIGNYKEAFPDFPEALPEIDGFVDHSWYNDACPCLVNKELHLRLMVDYPNPEDREYGDLGVERYQLDQLDENDELTPDKRDLIHTDDLAEVLAMIEEIRAAKSAPGMN